MKVYVRGGGGRTLIGTEAERLAYLQRPADIFFESDTGIEWSFVNSWSKKKINGVPYAYGVDEGSGNADYTARYDYSLRSGTFAVPAAGQFIHLTGGSANTFAIHRQDIDGQVGVVNNITAGDVIEFNGQQYIVVNPTYNPDFVVTTVTPINLTQPVGVYTVKFYAFIP